ncbi:MAG TPA: molybdopterin molybdotransferase MoeA, partial [Candidatus Baltobacteraceae bacterium]|nr:molybdopterin molybdotransferase MoeA [Candidatus Baltobacteraceae bacterium]
VVSGEVLMGTAPVRALGAREAWRIPTGGALPEGADAVVPFEDVDERDGSILLRESVRAGDYVTQRGDDMRAGEIALEAGRRIGAPELGVLATLGITSVPVFERPRFGIISTGDELVEASATPGPGQVRDSNRFAIAGALHAFGVTPVHLPRVNDDFDSLRTALTAALEECDGVVLTGGSSVGARDLTPHAVAALGEPGVVVHGIRVKPGKPTLLGAAGAKPILGLPGNPTSALMILEAVARPIVVAATGERPRRALSIEAQAARPFEGRAGWTWYVPARLRSGRARLQAEPLAIRSSHVALLARAGGYVTIGESPHRIETGEPVQVTQFSSGGSSPEGPG